MNICIAVLLLIFFNLIPIAYAEEEPISISLDCYEPCKDTVVNYSKEILFELTIKNNFDEWIELGSLSDLYISVSNDNLPNNGKDYRTYSNLLGQSFFIKPKDTIKRYIPFDIYNKLDKDKRLGDWKVYPKLNYDINLHKNPFESSGRSYYGGQYYPTNSVAGNFLQFKVEKPETGDKVQKEKSSDLTTKGFWERPIFTNLIYPIISNSVVQIISTVVVAFILGMKFFRGKKKR